MSTIKIELNEQILVVFTENGEHKRIFLCNSSNLLKAIDEWRTKPVNVQDEIKIIEP